MLRLSEVDALLFVSLMGAEKNQEQDWLKLGWAGWGFWDELDWIIAKY